MKTSEFKVMRLRDTLPPDQMALADTPDKVAAYARQSVVTSLAYQDTLENMVVIFLNTRRRVLGHNIISTGTQDSLMVVPGPVFRAAILIGAAAIILLHNHPSGDPTPSDADIKMTRDLIRAGQLLKIEVLDHVILGHPQATPSFVSLRELGYFFTQ